MATLERNEPQSIFEHVGELRQKIFIILGAFILGATISHVFNKEIIAFLLRPAGNQHLIFLSPLEPLFFIFKIDFIGGFILSFPIIIWAIFSYITPALPKKLGSIVVLFYLTSTFLLFLGLIYAFFITIPLSLKFLFSITIPGIENTFSAEEYINFFITQTIIIIGVFQVPVLIIGGIALGLIQTKIFANRRRIIYLVLLIALAIITPTTDIFSLCIIFIPCLIIFEISLLGGKIIENLKKRNNGHLF